MKNCLKTSVFLFALIAILQDFSYCEPQLNNMPRLVIYDFELGQGDFPKYWSEEIPNQIRPYFVNTGRFKVLERKEMAKLWMDRYNADKLPKIFDPSTAVKYGKFFEANYALLGKLSKVHNETYISARLVSIETGIIEAESIVSIDDSSELRSSIGYLANSLISRIIRSSHNVQKDEKENKNFGYVQLTTYPSDCKVKLSNGTYLSSSGITCKLKAGLYGVSIVSEQNIYNDTVVTFTIIPKETIYLTVILNKRKGRLFITHFDSKIPLYIDGQFLSIESDTIVQLNAGFHNIALINNLGHLYRSNIFVQPDTIIQFVFKQIEDQLGINEHINLIDQSKLSDSISFLAFAKERIYIVNKNGILLMKNAYTLQTCWELADCNISYEPFIIDTKLYAIGKEEIKYYDVNGQEYKSYNNYIYEICPITGAILWKSKPFESNLCCVKHADSVAAFIFSSGLIIRTLPKRNDRSLLKIPQFGSMDWKTMQISNSHIFFLDKIHKSIYVFYTGSGQYKWSRNFDFEILSYIVDDSLILIQTTDNSLIAIDEYSGIQKWNLKEFQNEVKFFKSFRGLIYALSTTGDFYLIEKKDGSHISYKIDKLNFEITHSEADLSGRIFIETNDNHLLLFDPSVRNIIWCKQLEEGSYIMKLSNGIICFAFKDGRILTFGYKTRTDLLGWIKKVDEQNRIVEIQTTSNYEVSDSLLVVSDIYTLINKQNGPVLEALQNHLNVIKLIRTKGEISFAEFAEGSILPSTGMIVLQSGIVEIRSNPTNAQTWIDNSYENRTPLLSLGLKPGLHNIKIVHSEREISEATINILASGQIPYNFILSPLLEGTLIIKTIPPSAHVIVNKNQIGVSPVTFYSQEVGQTVEVRVEKKGYRSFRERIYLEKNCTYRNYYLDYSIPLFYFALSELYNGLPEVRGWPADSITRDGLKGLPIMANNPRDIWSATINLELPPSKFRAFGNINLMSQFDEFRRYEAGIKWDISRVPLLGYMGVGLSGMFQSALNSQPPSESSSAQMTTNFDKRGISIYQQPPLEKWHHPIPGVFVENVGKKYLIGYLYFRPFAAFFIDIYLGYLFDGALRGSALVEGPEGHLIKDPEREYFVKAKRGYLVSATLKLKSYAIEPLGIQFQNQYRYTEYGNIKEEGFQFSLGITLSWFE
jgi:outer membrane protein assembly factor BamB